MAYYLHARGCKDNYLTSKADAEDRRAIRQWLFRSLIKRGIWGSALDVLLTALRETIRDSHETFPFVELEREMRGRGKSLLFSKEEIEDLVDIKYGFRDLFALLTMLFPFVDTRNQFHIDHVFPTAAFHTRKLKQRGLLDAEIELLQDHKDRLPNLQLLQGPTTNRRTTRCPRLGLPIPSNSRMSKWTISPDICSGRLVKTRGMQQRKQVAKRAKQLRIRFTKPIWHPVKLIKPPGMQHTRI